MLVQDLGDVVLQSPELLVDVMEEVVQVGFVQLAALDQHLRVETSTMKLCYSRSHHGCVTLTTEEVQIRSSNPNTWRKQCEAVGQDLLGNHVDVTMTTQALLQATSSMMLPATKTRWSRTSLSPRVCIPLQVRAVWAATVTRREILTEHMTLSPPAKSGNRQSVIVVVRGACMKELDIPCFSQAPDLMGRQADN